MAIDRTVARAGYDDAYSSRCCTSTFLVNETEEDMVVREEFGLDAHNSHGSPSYITRYIIPSNGQKKVQVPTVWPWPQRLTTDDDHNNNHCIRFRIFAKSERNHCEGGGDDDNNNIEGSAPAASGHDVRRPRRRRMSSWRRFLSIPCFVAGRASSKHSAAASSSTSTDSSTITEASSNTDPPPTHHHFEDTRLCFNSRDLSRFAKIVVVSLPSGEYGLVKHLPVRT